MMSNRGTPHIKAENPVENDDSSDQISPDLEARLRSFKYEAPSPNGADRVPYPQSLKRPSLKTDFGNDKKPPQNSRKTAKYIDRPPRSKDTSTTTSSPTRRNAPPTTTSTHPSSSTLKSSKSAGYAPPSKYAHLSHLTDVLAPNLLILFVGLNPGVMTAQQGHAYAHPSNLFWRLLASSGITPTRYPASYDVRMPELCSCGFTNIVSRPTATQSELSRAEMVAGTPILEEKVRKWRPEAVCLVGKGIWEAVWEYRKGRKMRKEEWERESGYGWQSWGEKMGRLEGKSGLDGSGEKEEDNMGWDGAWTFVAASTSGASASLKPAEKEEIWRPLGEWVQKRRREKGKEAKRDDEAEPEAAATDNIKEEGREEQDLSNEHECNATRDAPVKQEDEHIGKG